MDLQIALPDDLVRRAQRRAESEGRTLECLVEEGLTLVLRRATSSETMSVDLPVSRATGGLRPGVSLNRAANLLETLDEG